MTSNQIKSLIPNFRLVKKRPKKIVLLIDRSLKSKSFFSTVEKVALLVFYSKIFEFYLKNEIFMFKAINDYIKLMVKENEVLGIIHFQNNAQIVLPLTKKDASNQKRMLQQAIPKISNNKTSNIWNGI